jgi:hypothetical protein
MVKQGNDLERFSELFVCRMGQALGLAMADYQPEGKLIKSPDFTDGASVNFESADGLVGDDEDYAVNFETFWQLSPRLAEQYLQIIYMDTLCFNMDRHTKNYGVLRDAESGEILSMAPNFDNNIALFARGIPKDLSRANDKLIALFREFLDADERAREFAKSLPSPTREMVAQCVTAIPVSVDVEMVRDFVMSGSELIQQAIREMRQEQGMDMKMY